MKQVFTVDRFRLWLLVALLAVVALGSFWVQEVMRRGNDEGNSRSAARAEPDYYVEDFNFVKLSNDGRSNYHITGERLNHRPRDDDFEIFHPKINSFDQDQTPVTMIADRAVIEQKQSQLRPALQSDEIHLYDNVNVERAATATSRGMKLQTDYLLLLPDLNQLKTDREVTMTSSASEVHAVGMVANTVTQEIELLHKVRASFSPDHGAARTATQ